MRFYYTALKLIKFGIQQKFAWLLLIQPLKKFKQFIQTHNSKNMQIQQNKKIVQVIQTTKGDIASPYSNPQQKIPLLLFNQILNPQSSKHKCNYAIDLQHLNYHKQNAYTLQNTSISWASIQHEIRQVIRARNLSDDDILVFDSSSYNTKIPQILSRFKIVKGYNYRLNLDSHINVSEQKKTLMEKNHVLKQIQMQFSLGNGQFKPGYIGQIKYQQLQNTVFQGIINAYVEFSSKKKCPIIINFMQQGQNPYYLILSSNSQSNIINRISKKFFTLQAFLQNCKQNNCSQNIVVYNLPVFLLLNRQKFAYQNIFVQKLQQFICSYNITLGFSLLRYSNSKQKQGINQIIKLIKKYPNNVILSSGLKYKTDLVLNSGQGLSLHLAGIHQKSKQNKNIYNMTLFEYLEETVDLNTLSKTTKDNILKLMDWKEKKEQIKIEIFWKCQTCKNDFSQKIQAFRKFGKQFCSIKCLKACKF